MKYKGYLIQARVKKYDLYEVDSQGRLVDIIGESDGDPDFPIYEVWSIGDYGSGDECLDDELETFKEAKLYIDNLVKRITTIQSKAGN